MKAMTNECWPQDNANKNNIGVMSFLEIKTSQYYFYNLKNIELNFMNQPITAQCCFSIPPENIKKPLGFLMFSGGIEKPHGAVMG